MAAWRATWAALQKNRVYAARYRHLTTRQVNKLTPTQAQSVIAEALLRQLHAVVVSGQAWDPVIRHPNHGGGGCGVTRFARLALRVHKLGRGEPSAASRITGISPIITGRPGSSSTQPDHTLSSTQLGYRYAGTDDEPGDPTPAVDPTASPG